METSKTDTSEEQLEYESDEDDYEVLYVESQAGGNENMIKHHVEDNTGNETEYFEIDTQEFKAGTKKENTIPEESEDDAEVEVEANLDEDEYDDEVQDSINSGSAINGKTESYGSERDSSIEYQGIGVGRFKDVKDGLEGGNGHFVVEISSDEDEEKYINEAQEEAEGENENEDGNDKVRETRCREKIEGITKEEADDPFNDDDLIEYVEDPDELYERPEVSEFGLEQQNQDKDDKEAHESGEWENTGARTLSHLPIYLDFCDLVSEKEKDLGNAWLNEEIKVDFDFMKLYPPECDEDEMYAEFDSLYGSLDECIGLKFSDILLKIKSVITNSCKIWDLETDIDIRLTFGDLMNFTVASDSLSSRSLTLEDVLISYERLKLQSPNADLHKFLLLRVWLSRNTLGQFGILKDASLNGYRLENLTSLISRKRKGELDDTVPTKRSKVGPAS
ncbi:hypothetical protein PMKS-002475 [Pichia membranifaciens]|uniref:Uncharacterized protein n=1 Tax=Pichia membranifaciens TaxID=4926 RepID=A0A1Q2YHE1_9ASCO|nr:hypothetical protein PMKS-002475 [Pichia membranifaciens]